MDVFAAIVLMVVMFLVLPVVVIGGTMALLGGSENLMPGAMRDRAAARRNGASEGH